MCCTFNMEEADKIFQQSQYASQVKEMQARDHLVATPKGAADLPKWFTEEKEPVPQAGVYKGLSLILDGHTNLLSPGNSLLICLMM